MLEHTVDPPADPARVVVLGSEGFVGSHLAARVGGAAVPLLTMDTDRIGTGPVAAAALAESLQADDAVVLAARRPLTSSRDVSGLMANLQIAETVCAALAARPVTHVVYLSAESVYPLGEPHINESSCAASHDLAGILHKTREVMLEATVRSPLAILRLANVYGTDAGDDAYGPTRLLAGAVGERTIRISGAGEEMRDHVLIDDACELISEVLRHRSRGLANIATGHSIDFATLAQKIAGLQGRPVEIQQMPRAAPITHRHFDITVLFKAFPRFAFTPLDQGLGKVHQAMTERRT